MEAQLETFNTPLEMPDLANCVIMRNGKTVTFNTPLEMPLPTREMLEVYAKLNFQYSIGDAGDSCPCFLRLFKFC